MGKNYKVAVNVQLLQVDTHLDVTLDVARMLSNNKQNKQTTMVGFK